MSLKKLGRYELIRVLGKGAMGMVYEGRDPNLDRRVAIKTIKVENLTAEEAAEYEVRFRTEARSAARLQHPNIVSVYDSDRDVDVAYLVMEFIQGDDLKHHLDKGDVYTLEQTLGIMSDLLSALDYAHRQNIVHRDIKPANLLIETSGRIKLTDFGVARIQDSGDVTRTQGSMVGTLKYMSPEQVQGQPIDSRADLFAAGIVLYQLLTGKRPFDGGSDFDVIQQIVSRPHPAPSTINTQLPAAIDAVVARALTKTRDERYATAQEFSAALQIAVRDAADATIAPQASRKGSGRSSTWTSAPSQPGDPIAMTKPGTSGGTSAGLSGSTVTQEVELVYWKDIKESEDIEDFEGFLARFPTGIYADLAQRRLKKLLAMAGEGASSGSQSGSSTILVTRATTPAPDEAASPAAPTQIDEDATVAVLPSTTASLPPPAKPETPAAATAKIETTNAPVAETSGRGRWAIGGVALVVVAGLGYALLSRNDSSGSTAGAASSPAPQMQASASVAPAPAASTVPSSMNTPAVAAAATPAAASSKPAPEPTSIARKPPKESAPTPKANPAPSASPPVSTTSTSKSTATNHSVSASEPQKPVDANASADPGKACEGRWFISYQLCMTEQCNKPAFKRHKVCEDRRAMEQRNLEQLK